MTHKQAVLKYLTEARRSNRAHRIGKDFVRGGWVPLWILRRPSIGGSTADVYMRELRRDHGIPIEKRVHIDHATGKETHIWLYRIAGDPDAIDEKNMRMRIGPELDRVKKEKLLRRKPQKIQIELLKI